MDSFRNVRFVRKFEENMIEYLEFKPSIIRGFDYYDCTGWKQKRYGKIAYDTSGEIINNMVPLFVKRQEIEAAIVKEKHKLTLNIDVHTAPDKIRVWQNMLDKGTIC